MFKDGDVYEGIDEEGQVYTLTVNRNFGDGTAEITHSELGTQRVKLDALGDLQADMDRARIVRMMTEEETAEDSDTDTSAAQGEAPAYRQGDRVEVRTPGGNVRGEVFDVSAEGGAPVYSVQWESPVDGLSVGRYSGAELAALQPAAEQEEAELEAHEEAEAANATTGNSLIPEDLRHVLSSEEIEALMDAMEESAVEPKNVPYTREEWDARFSTPIETPAGNVRMGEHQFGKLHPDGNEQHQDRRGWIGHIHATLTSPSIIVEQPSPEAGAEREYKYVFVKSFVNADGNAVTFFASVTVKKNDMEVVITNHFKKYKDVKNLLKKGKLCFSSVSPSGMQTEPNRSTASATTSEADVNAGASASKVTPSDATSQENGQKSLQPIPTRKMKKGTEVLYHEVPVARTLEELYDGTLTQPEVDAFVESNVRESRKAAERIENQPPKMGTDLAAYKQAKAEWQGKVDEARRKADYWDEVQAEVKNITGRQNESASRFTEMPTSMSEAADGAEYAALAFGGKMGLRITPESFRGETGLGTTEQRQLTGVIATAEHGGVSIEQAAEWLYAAQENDGVSFYADETEARDAIIEVLSQGNPRGYVARGRKEAARRDAEAEAADKEAWAQQHFHMSFEEYQAMEEQALPAIIEQYRGFDEATYYANLADNYEQQNERRNDTEKDSAAESAGIGRSGKLLQGEQPASTGGTRHIGDGQQGRAAASNVQGGVSAEDAHGAPGGGRSEVGAFGRIYRQFRGKAKEAVAFLLERKEGEAVGALHHKDVGDISIVWGNEKAGLNKISKKHSEVLDNLQEIIDGMHVVSKTDNRIKLESDTHFAVVSREYQGQPRQQWLLTAYEKKETSKPTNSRMDVDSNLDGKSDDTATRQSENVSSTGKSTAEVSDLQENGRKSEEKSESAAENKRREPLRRRANEWSEKTGVKVHIIEDLSEVQNKAARAALEAGEEITGWYVRRTGEVYIYLPNVQNESDIDVTYVHEVVAHKGMRSLLSAEGYDKLCDRVWNAMSEDARREYTNYPGVESIADEAKRRRAAADEYIAHLAEKVNLTDAEQTVWQQVVQFFREALEALGIDVKVSDAQLSELIRASYAKMAQERKTGAAASQETKTDVGEQDSFRFIGETGAANLDKAEEATTRLDNLGVAREMESAGKDSKSIKMATGWERGADGKWRYETEDNLVFDTLEEQRKKAWDAYNKLGNKHDRLQNSIPARMPKGATEEQKQRIKDARKSLAKLRGEMNAARDAFYKLDGSNITTLGEFLGEDNTLFQEYPELKDMVLSFARDLQMLNNGYKGAYIPEDKSIWVAGSMSKDEIRSTLGHEIQHAIQHIEGFAKGGNSLMENPVLAKKKASTVEEIDRLIEEARQEGRGYYDELYAVEDGVNGWLEQHLNATTEEDDAHREKVNQQIQKIRQKINKVDDFLTYLYERRNEVEERDIKLGYDGYLKIAGEVESRNVSKRMNYTPEQRRAELASETEDVAREDQIFIYDALESAMGSRVDKRMAEIAQHFGGAELSDTQRAIVDVFGGKENNLPISVMTHDGNARRVVMRQGTENKAGAKHSLFRHYGTNSGAYTADELLLIEDVLVNGERTEEQRRGQTVNVYKHSVDGVEYTVLTENKRNREEFANFYTNRSGNALTSNTQLSARDDSMTASEREVTDNSSPEQEEEVNFKRVTDPKKIAELEAIAKEEAQIIEEAKKNGTYLKAPNGKPTRLTPKQWAQVRTKAFKKWFGDWEKAVRIEKLKKSEALNVEWDNPYELNRDSAKRWMKDNLRKEYRNSDTGEVIIVSKVGINEVTAHGSQDDAHLKSLSAIPEMIEQSVFIDEMPNSKSHDKYDSYRYYVCGLKIDGVDYTAKIVIGVKDGSKYYDHRLTEIEKGTLIDNLNGLSNSVAENQNASISMGKDTKLLSLLQTNASKVVDANGEPIVVWRGENGEEALVKSAISFYTYSRNAAATYADYSEEYTYPYFLSLKKPMQLIETEYREYADGVFYPRWIENPEFVKSMLSGFESSPHNKDAVQGVYDKYENTGSLAFAIGGQHHAFRNYASSMGYDGVISKDTDMSQGVVMGQLISFHPSQIKSATDNVGTFGETEENIRFRVANDRQEVFVSNATRAVEAVKQAKATPEQWLAMIQKQGGLKAGEDKWMGLSGWLSSSDAKSLTKQEVLDFVNENRIRIEEVKYSQYGEGLIDEAAKKLEKEYKEIGWDAMRDKYPGIDEYFEPYNGEILWSENNASIGEYEDFIFDFQILKTPTVDEAINETREKYTTEGLERKREIALTVPSVEPYNRHDDIHFGNAGGGRAVAWARFGETEDSEGNKVLVIDEIQSKRHQDGREKGYKATDAKEKLDTAVNAYRSATQEHDTYRAQLKEKYDYGSFAGSLYDKGVQFLNSLTQEERAKLDELISKQRKAAEALDKAREAQRAIPDAPFDKNWHELAMKRMLRLAAEEGFDKVAWTTGAQQAERYDMGKSVDRIDSVRTGSGRYRLMGYKGGEMVFDQYAEKDRLPGMVGKELAAKMTGSEEEEMSFTGQDLQIGGQGMKGFYDKMLPSFVQKYTKKWGAKVGEVELPHVEESARKMWSVNVTPEMREDVMEGQVMFRSKQSVKNIDARNYGMTEREANQAIDNATAFVTGKSRSEARDIRLQREAARKARAKELYDAVLSGDFNDVTLRLIDNYISDVTPRNPYGNRISQRVPQAVERTVYGDKRTGAVDLLFGRISESAVAASERASKAGRRAVEEKKKELLKGWAIATGNWHTDLSAFVADETPFDNGKDSDVFYSQEDGYVIKASKGKPIEKGFPVDLDNIPLFNYYFPNTAYEILGYGEIEGAFVRILRQPLVPFADAASVSVDDRVAHMASMGFRPLNKAKTAFTNDDFVVADLQKANIVRDDEGDIRIIDADMKLHTMDVGGNYSYPDVEEDTDVRFHVYGRNSGYTERGDGTAISNRAYDAEESGTFTAGTFRKRYKVSQSAFNVLEKLGIIEKTEWHHTGKTYKESDFYSWGDSYRASSGDKDYSDANCPPGSFGDIYLQNKKDFDRLSKECEQKQWMFRDREVRRHVPPESTYVDDRFEDRWSGLLTEEEVEAKRAEHNEISNAGFALGSSFERRMMHEAVDDRYKRIAKSRFDESAVREEYQEKYAVIIKDNESVDERNKEIDRKNLATDGKETSMLAIAKMFNLDTDTAYSEVSATSSMERAKILYEKRARKVELLRSKTKELVAAVEDKRKKWLDKKLKDGTIERQERVLTRPEFFITEKEEMHGRYGWFDASVRYNRPIYYSGIDLKTRRNQNHYNKYNEEISLLREDFRKTASDIYTEDDISEYNVSESARFRAAGTGKRKSIFDVAEEINHRLEREHAERSELEAVNARFNAELEAFKTKTHKGLLHLGRPSEILRVSGVNAENMTLSPSVLHQHLKKHNLSADDIKNLPKSLQSPILVYKHGLTKPNIVVVTEMEAKGGKISISLKLDSDGNVVEVDNVRSVHSKDATRELERLSLLPIDTLKNNLKWVDKEKVSDWLGLPYVGERQDENPKLVSAANVIENFENPQVLDVKNDEEAVLFRLSDEAREARKKAREARKKARMAEEAAQSVHEAAAEQYEEAVKSVAGKNLFAWMWNAVKDPKAFRNDFAEAYFDDTRSVKQLQDAIEKSYGEKIKGFENVWWALNRKSSVDAIEMKRVELDFIAPMTEALGKLIKRSKRGIKNYKDAVADVEVYLNAVHGLERNLHMAKRNARAAMIRRLEADGMKAKAAKAEADAKIADMEAKGEEWWKDERRDYSGFTELFGEKGEKLSIEELEERARDFIEEFEDETWSAERDAAVLPGFLAMLAKNYGSTADYKREYIVFKNPVRTAS